MMTDSVLLFIGLSVIAVILAFAIHGLDVRVRKIEGSARDAESAQERQRPEA